MRALITTGAEVLLRLAEVPDPVPGANEVLVRVQATSLERGEVLREECAGGPAGRTGMSSAWSSAQRKAEAVPRWGPPWRGLSTTARGQLVAVPVDYLAPVPGSVMAARSRAYLSRAWTPFRALARGFRSAKRCWSGRFPRCRPRRGPARGAAHTTMIGFIRSSDASSAPEPHVTTSYAHQPDAGPTTMSSTASVARCLPCLAVLAHRGIVVSYASTLMEPAVLGRRWFGAHVGATLRSMLTSTSCGSRRSASDLAKLCGLIAAAVLVPHIDVAADWSRAW